MDGQQKRTGGRYGSDDQNSSLSIRSLGYAVTGFCSPKKKGGRQRQGHDDGFCTQKDSCTTEFATDVSGRRLLLLDAGMLLIDLVVEGLAERQGPDLPSKTISDRARNTSLAPRLLRVTWSERAPSSIPPLQERAFWITVRIKK